MHRLGGANAFDEVELILAVKIDGRVVLQGKGEQYFILLEVDRGQPGRHRGKMMLPAQVAHTARAMAASAGVPRLQPMPTTTALGCTKAAPVLQAARLSMSSVACRSATSLRSAGRTGSGYRLQSVTNLIHQFSHGPGQGALGGQVQIPAPQIKGCGPASEAVVSTACPLVAAIPAAPDRCPRRDDRKAARWQSSQFVTDSITAGSVRLSTRSGAMVRTTIPVAMMQTISP